MNNDDLVKFLIGRGLLTDYKLKKAFENVDRALFVPKEKKKYAYDDCPLLLEDGQTISQPWTVAFMTEALDVSEWQKILEIGTGSGYQTAILAELVGLHGLIATLEIRKSLFEIAKINLVKYKNILAINADGSKGWKKEAPYDRIIVTASATKMPENLLEQLKNNGIMVVPIGDEMYRIRKIDNKIEKEFLGYFAFVPLKE